MRDRCILCVGILLICASSAAAAPKWVECTLTMIQRAGTYDARHENRQSETPRTLVFVLPRCSGWVETFAPCLAAPRHPLNPVSLFG
jgi:hypothetical protein